MALGNGERYYSPAVGRFIQQDSWTGVPVLSQTLNRYAYAINNPTRYIDPTGFGPEQYQDTAFWNQLVEMSNQPAGSDEWALGWGGLVAYSILDVAFASAVTRQDRLSTRAGRGEISREAFATYSFINTAVSPLPGAIDIGLTYASGGTGLVRNIAVGTGTGLLGQFANDLLNNAFFGDEMSSPEDYAATAIISGVLGGAVGPVTKWINGKVKPRGPKPDAIGSGLRPESTRPATQVQDGFLADSSTAPLTRRQGSDTADVATGGLQVSSVEMQAGIGSGVLPESPSQVIERFTKSSTTRRVSLFSEDGTPPSRSQLGHKGSSVKVQVSTDDLITNTANLLSSGAYVPNARGRIRSFVTTQQEVYYRVYSGDRTVGSFLTKVRPKNRAIAREGLALPEQNTAEYIQIVMVPAGTRLQRSRALPAFGRRGGLEQFQLLDHIPRESFAPGIKFE
jgi:hypothetical protein